MLRKIYYLLSPAQRLLARRVAFFPVDVVETLTGKRSKNIPPRGLIYTGTGDFLEAGQRYLGYFRDFGGVMPDHHVLDVGCGIGRMALPLTTFLTSKGAYEGFDIVDTGINWCKKNISKDYPNFSFKLVNLKNDLYSARGSEASSFRFPYDDDRFDFVFLTSVFTHMIPIEVEHYMAEITRVLKKGGSCFATFFVYGEGSPPPGDKPYFSFPVDRGFYRLLNEKVESANVAFHLDYIKVKLAERHGLQIKTFVPGYWRDLAQKNRDRDFQDIIVFSKD